MKSIFEYKSLRRIARIGAIARSLLVYQYDSRRLLSAALPNTENNNSSHRFLRNIAIDAHAIEKGLAMERGRFRFGTEKLLRLKHNTLNGLQSESQSTHLSSAINALCHYYEAHKENSIDISDLISERDYETLRYAKQDREPASLEITRSSLVEHSESGFDKFAKSRHSIRSFCDKRVPLNLIEKVVNLSNTAPSVCNRQSARIRIFQDTDQITRILALHNGNKGFGHSINNLAIVCSHLGYFVGTNERNQPYVDGGIYLMNFLYSLHYYSLGAVSLNWAVSPDRDKQLRKVADIPDTECVICLVGFGYAEELLKITASKKLSANETLFTQ